MILRGNIYTPYITIPNGYLRIEGSEIVQVSSDSIVPQPDETVLDYSHDIIAPGFINLHVHGGAGADTMDAVQSAIETIARHQLDQGVTTFLPTTVSADRTTLRHVVSQLRQYSASNSLPRQERGNSMAQMAGIHVEGPFISTEKKGAQSEHGIRAYDSLNSLEALKEFVDVAGNHIRILTLAPERPDADALIRFANDHGMTIGLGHSTASFEQAKHAIDLGASYATHTFNAMPTLHHRQPGLIGAVMLDDRVYTELIADAVHLHPAMCQLLLKVKGEDRIVLVTDAVRCAGMADGDYMLGDLPITKMGQYVYLRDQVGETLAGSILEMNRGIQILVRQAGYTLEQALKAASTNPAHAIGLQRSKGSLEPGKDADLVVLNQDFAVKAICIQGQIHIRHYRK